MRWQRIFRFCIALIWAVSAAEATATTTFIKFDEMPDGQRIDEHYAHLGVHIINDFSGIHMPYRACPAVTTSALAWSRSNILVNECTDDRVHSSHKVPLVIWFDQPIAGVGMRLGRVRGTAPTATIALFDGAGNPKGQKSVALTDDFQAGTELWDPTETARLLIIDYGDDASPEALDDLAIQSGTGAAGLDTDQPIVVITSPLTNAIVANTPATLQGVVSDLSGVLASCKINGAPIKLSPRMGGLGKPYYEFTTNVALVKGSNPVTAMAWDRSGKSGSSSIVIHYGPPATVSLAEFHLTQRGIMRQGTVNIDYPMVAGKFTIARIRIEARTDDGFLTYVNKIKMIIQRMDGLNPVLVGELWGTSYSPYVSTFNSSSALAGVHFWLPGVLVQEPGYYRMIFQAYVGEQSVGSPMEIPAPENLLYFHQTRPLRLFILPTEAPLFAQDLGPEHQEQTVRVLQFVKRAFPIADDGLESVVAAPLPIGDGSAAMDAAQQYIQGTGVEWTFKDTHPTGIWRAPHTISHAYGSPIGGLIQTGALINLPSTTPYGLFRPGGPPQWDAAKYPIPMDDNHDGSIDDDMPNYMAEFYNSINIGGLPVDWLTDSQHYDQGETFRGFRDQDNDSDYDSGANDNFETGEPLAPMVRRWYHMRNNLLFGPALAARNAYNAATNSALDHAVLWFPTPFHPADKEFNMLGNGQGNLPQPGAFMGEDI